MHATEMPTSMYITVFVMSFVEDAAGDGFAEGDAMGHTRRRSQDHADHGVRGLGYRIHIRSTAKIQLRYGAPLVAAPGSHMAVMHPLSFSIAVRGVRLPGPVNARESHSLSPWLWA